MALSPCACLGVIQILVQPFCFIIAKVFLWLYVYVVYHCEG